MWNWKILILLSTIAQDDNRESMGVEVRTIEPVVDNTVED